MDSNDRQTNAYSGLRKSQQDATLKVLILFSAFIVVVVGFGFYSHSLVLLASAVHLAADAASLLIAYLAALLAAKPTSDKHSFGLVRAEVLGALTNGVILVSTSLWILVSAVKDFGSPSQVHPTPVIILGIGGIIVSTISLLVLHRSAGESLNMRAGVLHMAGDSAGWIITVLSGVALMEFHIQQADTVGAIMIALLVLISSWQLLSGTISVLLEATPRKINPAEIVDILQKEPDILDVHHLHLWNLASDSTALSAHVLMEDGSTLHKSQLKVESIKLLLKEKFGIDHVTIEIECHRCGDEQHSFDS